jgi:hypothetical protein
MRHFVRDAYDPAFDCREWSTLAASWCRPPDDGVCRTLVATRRVGKTWALKGLGSAIGETARYVDLRDSGIPTGDAGTWLLDEPAWNLTQGPVQRLAAWVRSRSGLGESVVLALTLAEHEAFDRAFDGYRGPVRRDLPALDSDAAHAGDRRAGQPSGAQPFGFAPPSARGLCAGFGGGRRGRGCAPHVTVARLLRSRLYPPEAGLWTGHTSTPVRSRVERHCSNHPGRVDRSTLLQ